MNWGQSMHFLLLFPNTKFTCLLMGLVMLCKCLFHIGSGNLDISREPMLFMKLMGVEYVFWNTSSLEISDQNSSYNIPCSLSPVSRVVCHQVYTRKVYKVYTKKVYKALLQFVKMLGG